MKFLSFQLLNFKSIIDSGECHLAEGIMILAGKNESGKTAILEGLAQISQPRERFQQDSVRLNCEPSESKIHFKFECSNQKLKGILDEAGLQDPFNFFKEHSFDSIIIRIDGSGYFEVHRHLEATTLKSEIAEKASQKYERVVKSFNKLVQEDGVPIEQINPDVDTVEDMPSELLKAIDNLESQGVDVATVDLAPVRELNEELDGVVESINHIQNYITKNIPRFVLFSSFNDTLKFSRPIAEIQDDRLLLDFFRLADIDPERIRNCNFSDPNEKHQMTAYLNDKVAQVNGYFGKTWQQDKVTLEAEAGDGNLNITIKDEDSHTGLKPEQRSAGFKWFLEFFLRLNAENTQQKRVILIDEPGLYLHGKAQADVLKTLEKLVKDHDDKIIFTTHTPYLIDPHKLNRIRIVTKTGENGTVIEKFHAKADIDAKMPIVTAIGYDVVNSLSVIDKNAILVEGISDHYYFTKLQGLLNDSNDSKDSYDFTFVPSVGATNISVLASFYLGYDIPFIAVFDHDNEGKKSSEKLKKNGIAKEQLLFVLAENDRQAEDLFSLDDFKNKILKDSDLDTKNATKSSDLFKGKLVLVKDKVLVSKNFFEDKTISLDDFSSETKGQIKDFFNRLKEAFSHSIDDQN